MTQLWAPFPRPSLAKFLTRVFFCHQPPLPTTTPPQPRPAGLSQAQTELDLHPPARTRLALVAVTSPTPPREPHGGAQAGTFLRSGSRGQGWQRRRALRVAPGVAWRAHGRLAEGRAAARHVPPPPGATAASRAGHQKQRRGLARRHGKDFGVMPPPICPTESLGANG